MSERMTDEQIDALVDVLGDDAAYQNMHRGAIDAITQLRADLAAITDRAEKAERGKA